jgi:hypothetical protein
MRPALVDDGFAEASAAFAHGGARRAPVLVARVLLLASARTLGGHAR